MRSPKLPGSTVCTHVRMPVREERDDAAYTAILVAVAIVGHIVIALMALREASTSLH